MNSIKKSNMTLLFLGIVAFSHNSFATKGPLACKDILNSRLLVRNSYASIIRTTRNAPKIAEQLGIENSELVTELVKVSALTGTDIKTLSEQALAVAHIKSPKGIPDGDEIDSSTLIQILAIANANKVSPESVFASAIGFLPLIEGKVGNNDVLMGLVKLKTIYNISAEDLMSDVDHFLAASTKAKEELAAIQKQQMEKMDDLTKALVGLSGMQTGEFEGEIVMAVIESAIAKKVSVKKGIEALETLMKHPKAIKYTTHERAAMLKALIVLGQPLDVSVSKLEKLQAGAEARFGTGLNAEIERPAVNLILLGGQSVDSVLEMLGHVVESGEKYNSSAAAVTLNRILGSLIATSSHPALINAAVVIPE